MIEVRDSFLRFLKDNLPNDTIHPLRKDPDNPASQQLKQGSINVGFGRVDLGVILSTQFVLIDVISERELDAVGMVQRLFELLTARLYTPLLDYTNPTSPKSLGTELMWKHIRFIPVDNDFYYQYSCTLIVQFHNKTSLS